MLRGILIAMTPSVNDSNGIVRAPRSFTRSQRDPPSFLLNCHLYSQAPCTPTHFCSILTRYSGRSGGFLAESADSRSRLLDPESRISIRLSYILTFTFTVAPAHHLCRAPAPIRLYLSVGGRSGRHHVRRPYHDRRRLAQRAYARFSDDVQTEAEFHNITLYEDARPPPRI